MARITAPTRWQRVQTSTDPTAAPTGSSPIYDQLAREWTAAGRTMPGRPDGEWTRLSLFPPPPPVAEEATARPASPQPRRGWLYDRHPA
ncbi:hypothetical protein [Streptomyces sp. V1I6]|uniref:hypothetical protein n=1 Tax=Streptomyces sp. V1I6 TaxID=3042273 RepID=UPI0027838D82|nr:hypothetical protein [Streptomyces sp. V1I6]MDQ0844756.1 hypothetical protein [Streptomyces sp. V1I6]